MRKKLRLVSKVEDFTSATSSTCLENNREDDSSDRFKKGFLLRMNQSDKRKKLCNEIEILSESLVEGSIHRD